METNSCRLVIMSFSSAVVLKAWEWAQSPRARHQCAGGAQSTCCVGFNLFLIGMISVASLLIQCFFFPSVLIRLLHDYKTK